MTMEQATTKPPHPGEVLRKEYLEPLGITGNKLALALHVTPPRIIEIVTGKRGITADTALRLAKCLNTSAEYWLTLQMQYDLAAVQKAIGERLEREIRPIISLEPLNTADNGAN
jgi:addiction module HigA family antidote